MRTLRTEAIVLNRTDYGEADRIMTFLTPDHGKVKAIAKGVRKTKSKLAGGIEYFSVSDISFIPGRREIGTVVSTRLIKHYGKIVKDLDRTNTGFELIKRLNKATEDQPEPAYFNLMQQVFETLNDFDIDYQLIETWFNMQLLRLAGHSPDLHTDTAGQKLSADQKYTFDFEKMHFTPDSKGKLTADHIKFLRIGFSRHDARTLGRVSNSASLINSTRPLVQAVLQTYVRV